VSGAVARLVAWGGCGPRRACHLCPDVRYRVCMEKGFKLLREAEEEIRHAKMQIR
jgi:hypothetical protein